MECLTKAETYEDKLIERLKNIKRYLVRDKQGRKKIKEGWAGS